MIDLDSTVKKRPVVLAILDGWGYGRQTADNAVHIAQTPHMDSWIAHGPFTTLAAHNGAVGLPEGQMGNSEVGHLNIGAGRVVYQDFSRINQALASGAFYDNPELVASVEAALANGANLHLFGLVSDGGVHSHLDHLLGLLRLCRQKGLERVYIHAFMDGRDTPPESGAGYMRQLTAAMAEIGVGRVAVICGRYYAMDRDNRWQRVEKAWQAMVHGQGRTATDPVAAVEEAYRREETDEFIQPVVMVDDRGAPLATVGDGDSVIFFNFRADRARQLTHAFTDRQFHRFAGSRPRLSRYLTFTRYEKSFTLPVAFPPQSLRHILGEEVSAAGLRQLRIAETEKYAHVTYFFNGGREEPFAGEDRVLVDSPREVATYDLKPEMSAFQVTEELLKRLAGNQYDFVVLNFANGDMVGHSGKLAAAVKACEAVDQCLGRLAEAILATGGTFLITADHGNAEIMLDHETGAPCTAHTLNPVPFLVVGGERTGARLRSGGALKDIAPTVLDLLGLEVPAEMEGVSLFRRVNQ